MMSSTNEEDPFLQVQQDVLAQMQNTRPLFASYLRIRSLSNTPAQSPEVASARSDLESALSTLAEDLADLVESVRAVEADPSHYGLSAHEVSRRKKLVDEVGGEVEDMREELASQTAAFASSSSSSGPSGSRAAAAARAAANEDLPPPSAFAFDEAGSAQGDDNYAEFEHQQQLQMMRDQDQELNGVFVTVGNLRRQADDMGRELEEQHEMLEHVDTLADRVGGRLQTGMQKLGHVMRRSEDRYSSCCIAVLITVLIILLVLLLAL
ncbi:SNARE domain-containing protein [Xylariaceae sp. AK1471]|nr:SNARE domain-containing protein [Xylariaceae sp. AK1471]